MILSRLKRRSVREIATSLRDAGVEVTTPIDPEAGDSGPAHVALVDPDGNSILIDQFF